MYLKEKSHSDVPFVKFKLKKKEVSYLNVTILQNNDNI